MLALYRSGRQADALEVYGAARATLVEELGTEPGAQLQELHRAILRQDADIFAGPSAAVQAEPRRSNRGGAQDGHPPVRRPVRRLRLRPGRLWRDQLRRRREKAVAALDAHGGHRRTHGRRTRSRDLRCSRGPRGRCRASCCSRRARAPSPAGSSLRAGVATGDVITGDPALGRPLVSGPPLEEADRLLRPPQARRTSSSAASVAWRLVRHAITPRAAARRACPSAQRAGTTPNWSSATSRRRSSGARTSSPRSWRPSGA